MSAVRSQSNPKLLQQLRSKLRLGHYSPRTVQAYTSWVRRFVRFHGLRHPRDLGERDVAAFLNDLVEHRRIAPSTQAQALSALLFLYREVLARPLGDLGRLVRARAPSRLPVVLTRGEVARVLGELRGVSWLIAVLLYGGGLRIGEAVSLRVKDLDLERGEIRIRRGKGQKDRVTVLPGGGRDRSAPCAPGPRVAASPARSRGWRGTGRAPWRSGCQVSSRRGRVALAVGVSGGAGLS